MSESLLSFLLVRQPEKQPLSDSTINSKLNFVGKHKLPCSFLQVPFCPLNCWAYRFDLMSSANVRDFLKNNTYINRVQWHLSMVLSVFFPKIMGVGMLPHRTGFLHTFFGKCLF